MSAPSLEPHLQPRPKHLPLRLIRGEIRPGLRALRARAVTPQQHHSTPEKNRAAKTREPGCAFTTYDEVLSQAADLLTELRQKLDLIRAVEEREELLSAVQKSKGHLTVLREELEETMACRGGRKLTQMAEELERELGYVDEEEVFSIGELRELAQASPRALDSSYRSLQRAWEASVYPEQFERHMESAGCRTSLEFQVKNTLLAYFYEAKSR
ncbi:hypothetical protein [Metapseudomonas otitidis]|uniref:hypothetical protein n=1 Tax=Metapseudomonas otitidis TaxID=319939 RepID=UPI002448293B|nr:hypothetical protein [Pseudomonas otitidis]MDH0334931.1 hypothetical protein [Pseudomonas otitidis]